VIDTNTRRSSLEINESKENLKASIAITEQERKIHELKAK
jgi:hypothetical protein